MPKLIKRTTVRPRTLSPAHKVVPRTTAALKKAFESGWMQGREAHTAKKRYAAPVVTLRSSPLKVAENIGYYTGYKVRTSMTRAYDASKAYL